ncbi:ABC transporter permease subunit [Paracoccus sp. S-4012]|uniref:ABC transporter permease n=1 Tax=Paracoccus sp. S-4012 TaxID=2665648 RepID=UPI0012AFF2F3|nr:ABC transporter permease [Paracoccus sp. S-4012]MRX51796.1 ABC transporter permease subunit [Paracoccus sp. S-4012]
MTDATHGVGAATPGPARVSTNSPMRLALRRLMRHRSFRVGLVMLLLIVLLAWAAPWITNGTPNATSVRVRFTPPSLDYPFGTDNFGRDLWTRVVYGARVSLWIGFTVALLSAFFGGIIGVCAAWFRRLDSLLMRIMDALMAFPAILLAIGVSAVLGPQLSSVIIALTSAYIPRCARMVRASALVIREQDYVEAARISGASSLRIILRHILPNCLAPLLVTLTFVFAYAILAEATLSFLGIGTPPPHASWGNIVAQGRDFAVEAWWIMLFPGLAISISALSINLMGDGLRDVLDPRLKIEG